MRSRFTILLICIFHTPHLFSQPINSAREAFKLLDSATVLLCVGDTANAIETLEGMASSFPTNGMIVIGNRALGELYVLNEKPVKAKQVLHYALNYNPTDSVFFLSNRECDKLIRTNTYSRAKADICVLLSKLQLREGNYDSSLYFLDLANNEFLPYRNCGNGMNMYRSYLSTFFADHYLTAGDTTKATAALLDNLMNLDGNSGIIAQKLKAILLHNWTQRQITAEVDRGLKTMTFSKAADDAFWIRLTLFGYTFQNFGSGKMSAYKKLYPKYPGIVELQKLH